MRKLLNRCLMAAFGGFLAVIALAPAGSAASFRDGDGGNFAELPGWSTDRVADVIPLFAASCPRLGAAFRPACDEIRRVPRGDEAAARAFLQWAFRPAYIGQAQYTGYFELDVAGALAPGGPYQWPLLRAPANPTLYDRAQILGGALAGRGLELVWFASAADLYFVQLQGSARVHLPDGTVMRVGGAAQNGRRSIPTAQLFGDAGIANHDLSIPGIRAWSAAHPADTQARLARETSYFFFAERPLRAEQGPVGALGVPLAPLRSVAVDAAHIPLGTPVWISTSVSATRQPLQRLMLSEDTGEPINGPAHVDLFFGGGPDAEAVGGRQNSTGGLWALVPR